MLIAFGADHGGVILKNKLIDFVRSIGHDINDVGPFDQNPVDYPDLAQQVARIVAADQADFGVLICRTGVGMSISANKIRGIRAALVYTPGVAELSRRHNNANVICFGADFMRFEETRDWLQRFLETDFEGGRHQRRVMKIEAGEQP
jgi:ribose 5-phosphate isomerase B